MKELSAVIRAEELVTNTLANKEAETDRLHELLEREDAEIAKANKAMEEATAEGDVKAYQKAKAFRQDVSDAKEMHEARLDTLEYRALIPKAEYEKTVSDIYAEVTALEDGVKQKLADLSNKMNDEALKLEEAVDRANSVLSRLQVDIYRNEDRRKGKDGSTLVLPHETKQINKWETIHWGQRGVSSDQYMKYTGKKA